MKPACYWERKKASSKMSATPLDKVVVVDIPHTVVEYDYLQELFDSYPLGQKRTGRGREFVFMAKPEVIKGPYKKDKFNTIIRRARQLWSWDSPRVTFPMMTIESPQGYFIIYEDLALNNDLPYETIVNKESFTSYQYDVVVNNPVQPLNHAYDPKLITKELLLSLCHCAVLGVGDMHLRNILVSSFYRGRELVSEAYVTDYDEQVGTDLMDREDTNFYFTLNPAKKWDWENFANVHLSWCATQLTSLLSDEQNKQYYDRINHVIALCHKYATSTSTSTSTKSPNSTKSKSSKASSTKSCLDMTRNEAIADDRNDDRNDDIKCVVEELGDAIYIGPMSRNNRSAGGFSPDVLKSGLQKYIRRNMYEKAALCMKEMLTFRGVGNNLVSNVLNRLVVIAAEDIGIANVPLVLYVIIRVNELKMILTAREWNAQELNEVYWMIKQLSESSKTRVMSHISYVYVNPLSKAERKKHRIVIDSETKNIPEDRDIPGVLSIDDPDMLRTLFVIDNKFENMDFSAFTWIERFIQKFDNDKIKLRLKFSVGTVTRQTKTKNTILSGIDITTATSRTSKPHILIWKAMAKYVPEWVVSTIYSGFSDMSEKRPFASLAICCVLYRDYIEFVDYEEKITTVDVPTYQLVIDDYVVDKHTAQGRANGKTGVDFVMDGAYVTPQDPVLYEPLLHKIYQSRQ